MISLLAQSSLSPFLSWLMTAGGVSVVVVGGILALFSQFFRKVGPEEAIVRSGAGGLRAKTGKGIFVIPILHRSEVMDLSLKRIEIKRRGEAGLICKDNVRADIEVAFYVRVNNKIEDILQVAGHVQLEHVFFSGSLTNRDTGQRDAPNQDIFHWRRMRRRRRWRLRNEVHGGARNGCNQ